MKSNTNQRGRLPVWKTLLLDVLLTGIALLIFALFHHVLPMKTDTAAVTVINPSQDSLFTPSETTPEEAVPEATEGKFDHLFTEEPVWTEDSYSSPSIHVSVSKHTTQQAGYTVAYYVADIYLKDIRCFQTYFAGNTYSNGGYSDDILNLSREANAIVATNGDFYSYQSGTCVLRNGVLYRYPSANADLCVLNYDGTMVTYRASEVKTTEAVDAAIANAWQVWSFGPALLDENGRVYEDLDSYSVLRDSYPRTAIGYMEPGHYCFVVVDGRQDHSVGARIVTLAEIFEELGCVAAYNLDGGGSSRMTFHNEMYSIPSEARNIPDIVLIAEYEGSVAQQILESVNTQEVSE